MWAVWLRNMLSPAARSMLHFTPLPHLCTRNGVLPGTCVFFDCPDPACSTFPVCVCVCVRVCVRQPRDVTAIISRLLTSNPDSIARQGSSSAFGAGSPSAARRTFALEATLLRSSPSHGYDATAKSSGGGERRPSVVAQSDGGAGGVDGHGPTQLPYQVQESPTAALNLDVMHRSLDDLTVSFLPRCC
jgi:hypothetical protein